MDTPVRSIVYFWWRKAEEDLRIIKFGDHTEPLTNANWYESTEKYIQRTSAPRESNTWKKTINYQIFDVTEYAKKVHRNRKYAKIDNYITRQLDLDKYRLGQTDQFELPKYGIDFDDFIDKVRDLVYGNHTTSKSLPIDMTITVKDLNCINDHQFHIFKYTKPITILTYMMNFLPDKILIITNRIDDYKSIFAEYTAFNNYVIATGHGDGRFNFAEKKILITNQLQELTGYDFVIKDLEQLEMCLVKSTVSLYY